MKIYCSGTRSLAPLSRVGFNGGGEIYLTLLTLAVGSVVPIILDSDVPRADMVHRN